MSTLQPNVEAGPLDLSRDRSPVRRPRRLRRSVGLRGLVRETVLTPNDFVEPLFVADGIDGRIPVPSMPGVHQLSIGETVRECRDIASAQIPAVILFGIPDRKDDLGTEAYAPDGIVQRAVRAIKDAAPDLVVMTDVCLCEYTSHGHCGVVDHGEVLNDPTLDLLARTAVSHAEAGADVVAPSDMMDGRVAAIRAGLDSAGRADVPILSYAAKYASSFYGPFREAAESAPQFGDRRGYQMDPANGREALHEVQLDLDEGADMVMVKPALAFLDVLWRVKAMSPVPVGAYNVSGEYAMLMAAAERGWIDGQAVMFEVLHSIKRAGADFILTYHARAAARALAWR
ncbi:MAG TPA: porphobilinogen synthase [Chloroflexota bacterium]|nr:porphobilinogen synthase [Chloroflexota bacterium]